MNKDDIMAKAKEFMNDDNIEKAKAFLEEHKDDLGEHFDKAKDMLGDNAGDIVNKVKGLFGK